MRTLRLLPPFIHEVTDVGLANFEACLQAANFVAKLGKRLWFIAVICDGWCSGNFRRKSYAWIK